MRQKEHSPKNATPAGYVKKETLLAVGCIALLVGFLGGVTFGVYRAGSLHVHPAMPDAGPNGDPAPVASAPAAGVTDALEKEAALHPETPEVWVRLGNHYFDSAHFDKAIDAYQKALALAPGNADVWTDMGIMHRRKGQPQKAVDAFDRANAADPRHEPSLFNKGVVLMHDLNDMPGAIKVWEDLLAINPKATVPGGTQSIRELVEKLRQSAKPMG